MKVRRIRQSASVLCSGAVACVMAACLSVTEPPQVLFWEGTFVAVPPDEAGITGSAVMVSNPHNTEAGVFLSGLSGTTLSWLIRTGTCEGSGERVAGQAAFPPVLLPTIGEGTGIAVLNFRIEAGTYSIDLFAGANAEGAAIACADLIRTD